MSELTPRAAEIRLAQYGERGKPFECGNEKALYEIALTLQAEIDRLRAELAQVSSEIVRFGIYGAPVPAVEALVKRADELVTENTDLRTELEALKPTAIQTCGRTQAVSGDEYPPCARHAGHRSAYCRSADGRTYFLAAAATQPNRTDAIEGGDL